MIYKTIGIIIAFPWSNIMRVELRLGYQLFVALFLVVDTYNSLVSDNRPARKDYNKLSGEENSVTYCLDNEPACKDDCANNESTTTDIETNFTDVEIDDRDDFSDDSDYGTYLFYWHTLLFNVIVTIIYRTPLFNDR